MYRRAIGYFIVCRHHRAKAKSLSPIETLISHRLFTGHTLTMTEYCPKCDSPALGHDGGGIANWTVFECGNVEEEVMGTLTYTNDCEGPVSNWEIE